jgi:hypothetical protein
MPNEPVPNPLPLAGSGIVTFRPAWGANAPRLYLTCDSWKRTAGLSPDMNTAIVPYAEFAKLNSALLGLYGDIEFWFRHHPADSGSPTPDVVLSLIYLISATPETRGIVLGESSPRSTSYRLTFADHRIAWQPPRGGMLFDGRLNPEPLAGATLLTNQALANKCLAAMGASQSAPPSMNGVEPMREIDWSAQHAPTALQELLEHTQHIYCPSMAGPGSIQQPFIEGEDPYNLIPSNQFDTDHEMPSADARPVELILTSAPAAEIETWTEAATTNRPTWQYVAQDPDDNDKWKPLGEIAAITANGSVSLAWTKNLIDTPVEKRDRLAKQMYRCVRVDQTRYPAGKVAILTEAIDHTGAVVKPRIVRTNTAIRHPSGAFVGRSSATIDAEQVVPDANVLIFPHPIVGLANNRSIIALEGQTVVAEADLKINFSVEAYDVSNERKKCSVFGFTTALGSVASLSESTARGRLRGFRPHTAIQCDTGLAVIKGNDGAATNRSTLETRAQSYAESCLGQETAPARMVTARAFVPMELSGRVSSITYQVYPCRTEVTADDFTTPVRNVGGACQPAGEPTGTGSGTGVTIGGPCSTGKSQSRKLEQAEKRERRKAARRGTANDAKRSEPTGVQVEKWEAGFVLLYVIGPITGRVGIYSADAKALIPNASASGELTIDHLTNGDGVTNANGTSVVAWYPQDIGKPEHRLDPGSFIGLRVGTESTSNKPVYVILGGRNDLPLPPAGNNYEVLLSVNGNWVADHPRFSV